MNEYLIIGEDQFHHRFKEKVVAVNLVGAIATFLANHPLDAKQKNNAISFTVIVTATNVVTVKDGTNG